MILENNYKANLFDDIIIMDRFLSEEKLYRKIIFRFFYLPFYLLVCQEFSSLIMLRQKPAGNSYFLKFRIGNNQISDIQGKPYNFNP